MNYQAAKLLVWFVNYFINREIKRGSSSVSLTIGFSSEMVEKRSGLLSDMMRFNSDTIDRRENIEKKNHLNDHPND